MDAVFITLGKKTPIQKTIIRGQKDLDFWIDMLEVRDQIPPLQEAMLTSALRKWCTTIIHGHYDLAPNKANIIKVKGKTAGCGIYYVLVPTVTAIGINNGAGVLIIYLPKAAKEAEQTYQEARARTGQYLLEKHTWDEVRNPEEKQEK